MTGEGNGGTARTNPLWFISSKKDVNVLHVFQTKENIFFL